MLAIISRERPASIDGIARRFLFVIGFDTPDHAQLPVPTWSARSAAQPPSPDVGRVAEGADSPNDLTDSLGHKRALILLKITIPSGDLDLHEVIEKWFDSLALLYAGT